jgi:hypothetical protein
MKYRSFKLSARDRVAQNRILAGLVSASIVDIWRNVVGISPSWDDSTILPSKFCVGASSQLLVFCMDSVDNMIHSPNSASVEQVAKGLSQNIRLFERGLIHPNEMGENFLGQHLSDEILREQLWQQYRAPLASLDGREAEFAEYLPIAFSALALESNWSRAKQALCYISQEFQVEVNYHDFWQTWMAFHYKEDLNLLHQNLEQVILDFKISPCEALLTAFKLGLRDGLKAFYNSWPSRMDAFEALEVIADKLAKNLHRN